MFECDNGRCRSVAVQPVLCMLYKIRCKLDASSPCGALPVPFVPVLVTRGAQVFIQFIIARLDNLIS